MIKLRFIPAGAGNTACHCMWNRPVPVYPRWRGEHDSVSLPCKSTSGLSPLARGTRCEILPRNAGSRFIPAGAGNTNQTRYRTCRRSVYPRWRGEHLLDVVEKTTVVGLSPLARGTPTFHV